MAKEKTYLAHALEAADVKARYDYEVKKILSDRHILSWIMKYTVREFAEADVGEILRCIEGKIEVGTVPVTPGRTNTAGEAVSGMSTVDQVPGEGEVLFDIRFHAFTPDAENPTKLLFDVEAQKKVYVGYDLVTRGVFYDARMLSAQKGVEFSGQDYDSLKKVYSIFICMGAPKWAANTITEYRMTKAGIYGADGLDSRYDLLSVVMIYLGKDEEGGTPLHRLLHTILSDRTPQEKEGILENEYGIPMRKEVFEAMCNLSDLVEERGIKKGIEITLINLVRRGLLSASVAAEELGISEAQVLKMI